MASQTRSGTDHEIARLAARQHGVVSRVQLRRLGRENRSITRAVAAGRLYPVFRGVYAVGRPEVSRRGRMMGAVLACGAGTVISHASAAALLGLIDRGPEVIDVTAPRKRGAAIDGIKAHWAKSLRREETGRVARIPCSHPARTLVDLAGMVGKRTLSGAFEVAAFKGLLDLDATEAVLGQSRRRGAPTIRAVLGEWRAATSALPSTPQLRSPFEAKLLPLLATSDLPMAKINAPVQTPGGRLEVDLLWPDHRFVVEADSRRHHGTEIAFERDRWRDRELMRAGYVTLRVPWRHAEDEPEAVLDAIRARLSVRTG
jgi:very-short-patch-repair endonuclease/predicted transcriptional regulator of viral defense system